MRARSATHRRGRGHDAPRACAGRRVPARHGPTVSQSRARALGPGLGATMSTADTLRPPLAALRAAARQLIRDGYKVLPTNGKAPWDAAAGTGRVGWNAFQLTLESIGREIVPPITGLGVRLGEPSGDLVDVDLDCPEAQAAAPLWLPRTAGISGPARKPETPGIYPPSPPPTAFKCADAPGVSQAPPTFIELRSTGLQTVWPPSLHVESGEQVRFDQDGRPTRVEPLALTAAVRQVGATALLTRY